MSLNMPDTSPNVLYVADLGWIITTIIDTPGNYLPKSCINYHLSAALHFSGKIELILLLCTHYSTTNFYQITRYDLLFIICSKGERETFCSYCL